MGGIDIRNSYFDILINPSLKLNAKHTAENKVSEPATKRNEWI